MKKQITVLCASALAACGLAAVVGQGKDAVQTSAAQYTNPTSVVAYEQDFEMFEVGDDAAAIWSKDQLFWFNDNISAPQIVERSGRKGLQYKWVDTGNGTLGGIGSGATSNLSKLVQGQKYRVSFYLELDTETDGGFVMEPQCANWTGVKITNTTIERRNWQSTTNVQGHDNVYSFDFVVDKNPADLYIAVFAELLNLNDTIFIDDFKIEAVDTIYGSNFRSGLNETTNQIGFDDLDIGPIEMVYGNDWGAKTVICQGEGSNRYLRHYTEYGSQGENWSRFYLNDYPDLALANRNVRVTLDYTNNGCDLVKTAIVYDGDNSNKEVDVFYDSEVVDQTNIFSYAKFGTDQIVVEFTPEADFSRGNWGTFVLFALCFNGEVDINVNSIVVEFLDGNASKAAFLKQSIEGLADLTTLTDLRSSVSAARSAYDMAGDGVKGLLVNGELDVLAAYESELEEIKDVEDKIDAIGTVELSPDSKLLIDIAREAYEALSDHEKGLFDSSKLDALEAAEETYVELFGDALDEEVELALDALEEFRETFDNDNYYAKELMLLNMAYANGLNAIMNVTELGEAEEELENAKEALEEVMTMDEVDELVALAVEEAKEELSSFVDTEDFDEEEQEDINEILELAFANLDEAETLEEVAVIVNRTKNALEQINTSRYYEISSLLDYKEDLLEYLLEYLPEVDGELYEVYLKDEFEALLSYYAGLVKQAESIEEIDEIYDEFYVAYMQNFDTDYDYSANEALNYLLTLNAVIELLDLNAYREEEFYEIYYAYNDFYDEAYYAYLYAAYWIEVADLETLEEHFIETLTIILGAETDAELTAMELDAAKESAITTLGAYDDAANYTVNVEDFQNAKEAGVAAINNAETVAAVAQALVDASEAVDNVNDDTEASVAATLVDGKIMAIGAVSLSSECALKIKAAEDAFNALTEGEQELVTKLDVLNAAKDEYVACEEADEVMKLIDAIGDVEFRVACKARITDAREAYDALSDAAKAKVSEESLAKLVAAEETYASLKEDFNRVGCAGSVVATSGIITLVTLLGAGLLASKRKED